MKPFFTCFVPRLGFFCLSASLMSTTASASYYEYSHHAESGSYLTSVGGSDAGFVTDVVLGYNSDSSELSFELDVARIDYGEIYGPAYTHNQMANGFWLVLNNGGSPSGYNNFAVLYGDTVNNRLTAYTYVGQNNGYSYRYGEFIESFSGALDTVQNENSISTAFTIDASVINGYTPQGAPSSEWEGAQFDEQIGIWLHPMVMSQFSYTEAGEITSGSNYLHSTAYDIGRRGTTVVSVPAAAWLFLSGLLGLTARKITTISAR